MSDVVFRKGKGVVLRPIEEEDVPLLTIWMNDPDVTQYLRRFLPASKKEENDWVRALPERNEHHIVFGIQKVGGPLIGTMGLHNINWVDRVATTGALIGSEADRGQGYGTEAKMLLLDYAFNTLNLRKICSVVLAFNGRSQRYSEKCGYRVEGILRQHVYRHGTYYDEVHMAVFRDDWLPLWEAFQGKQ